MTSAISSYPSFSLTKVQATEPLSRANFMVQEMTSSHHRLMNEMIARLGRDEFYQPQSLGFDEHLVMPQERKGSLAYPSVEARSPRTTRSTSVVRVRESVVNPSDPSRNYEKTTFAQCGPSGILESATATRDSQRKLERVEVLRQLGEQCTQLERVRKMDTGVETLRKTTYNIPDKDFERFDRQWRLRASTDLPLYYSNGNSGSGMFYTSPSQPKELVLPSPSYPYGLSSKNGFPTPIEQPFQRASYSLDGLNQLRATGTPRKGYISIPVITSPVTTISSPAFTPTRSPRVTTTTPSGAYSPPVSRQRSHSAFAPPVRPFQSSY